MNERTTAPGAWRWVAILMAAYAVAVIDRVGIGLLVGPIKRDLALSDTMLGLIQGSAFGLFYVGLALPIGRMVDRGERRLIVAGGLAIWSFATLANTFVHGAAGLFAARLLVGAGEATLTPASASLIGDLFSDRRRPLAFGVLTVGVGLGIGIAFAGVGAVLAHAATINGWFGAQLADWRIAFVVMALPGFVLAAGVLLLREPDRKAPPQRTGARITAVFDHIRAAPAPFIALIGGSAMLQLIGTVMIAWFPAVLARSHGLAPASIGAALGPVAIGIGIPSALVGGWLVARLSRADPKRAPFGVLAAALLGYPLLSVAALLAPDATTAIACYAASVLFSNWAVSGALSGLAVITPADLRGRMAALLMMTIGVISLGVGPALAGWFADLFFAGQPRGIAIAAAMLVVLAGVTGAVLLGLGYRRLPTATLADKPGT